MTTPYADTRTGIRRTRPSLAKALNRQRSAWRQEAAAMRLEAAEQRASAWPHLAVIVYLEEAARALEVKAGGCHTDATNPDAWIPQAWAADYEQAYQAWRADYTAHAPNGVVTPIEVTQ